MGLRLPRGLGPSREAGFPLPPGQLEQHGRRQKTFLWSRLGPPSSRGIVLGWDSGEVGRGREGKRPASASNGQTADAGGQTVRANGQTADANGRTPAGGAGTRGPACGPESRQLLKGNGRSAARDTARQGGASRIGKFEVCPNLGRDAAPSLSRFREDGAGDGDALKGDMKLGSVLIS